MNKARIADLKNNLSRYLAYVREGGEVLVLDRDTPVARLVPFAGETTRGKGMTNEHWDEERLGELERQGLLKSGDPRRVREWLEAHKPVALPPGSGSVVRALLEMRDEDTR